MRWAIVIGIDEYDRDDLRLDAAVSDAQRFRDWVTRKDGGNVQETQLKLLLGPAAGADSPDARPRPTKDNIVTAINDVVTAAGDEAERLYFYFSGHGITARVSNRDEGALVTPGFDEVHTDHSLAIRSLTEHFETTPFKDQFFFIDACRNIPWKDREFEIGRWPIPRERDPGKPPVQQFILFATSPGLTAAEGAWSGAFTDVLMDAFDGKDRAKAWSWERNCYEVRWERLATYVNKIMSERRQRTQPPAEVSPVEVPYQIPQDAGSRGVAGRDRDALMVSFPQGHFPSLKLKVKFALEPPYERANMSVLDAIGQPVVSALGVAPGASQEFDLPPRTYAVQALTTDNRVGVLRAPIELYETVEDPPVELSPPSAPPKAGVEEAVVPEDSGQAGSAEAVGTIAIEGADPLAAAEIRDEAGLVRGVVGTGDSKLPPGFYRVSAFGPERTGDEQFVVLKAGEREPVTLKLPPEPDHVAALAEALGVDRAAWAQASTYVTAAVGKGLQGCAEAWRALGLEAPRERRPGVAFLAVPGDGNPAAVEGLSVRIWPAGDAIPKRVTRLVPSDAGVAAVIIEATATEPHWLAVEPARGDATVVALPLLPHRLATVIAQVDADRARAYQLHPVAGAHESSTPQRLISVEYLERQLLSGRIDGAEALAKKLAEAAGQDPFAGCVAGYVLLRLGCHRDLAGLASSLAVAAPNLSDAYILRGECEAAAGSAEAARQAFTDAVTTGIPAFGEGLTRLLEGLRANGFVHPRGALVRHIFQRHAQGSMWAAFVPRRKLKAGALVITGADVGFEG
jgi:hypothetical protein